MRLCRASPRTHAAVTWAPLLPQVSIDNALAIIHLYDLIFLFDLLTHIYICIYVCISVEGAAAAVQNLSDATAQASYLVGVSHPSTQMGQQGLVDMAMVCMHVYL